MAHIYSSANRRTHKERWIARLADLGLKPGMVVLQSLNESERWADAEREWIAKGVDEGWPLTNVAAGGEGSSPLDDKARSKKLAEMGRPETRARMSASAKARWADPRKRERALSGLRSDARRALQSQRAKERATPEYRAAMSAKTRAAWADPKKKSRILAGITPEVRTKVSEAAKRMWANSDRAEVMLANLRLTKGGR